MNRQRKKPKNPERGVTSVAHGGRVGLGDPASRALRRAGGDLGNRAVQDHVQTPNALRDELLQTIVGRLKGLRSAQLMENSAHQDSRNLERRAIYMGADHQADPGRFRDVARRYQEAAQALASGQLDRGARILEEAHQQELAVHESIPDHVRELLGEQTGPAGSLPDGLAQISSGATCSRCNLPQELVIADWIQALDPHIALRGVKGKDPHNWWDEDQEDDEDDGDGA